MGAWGGRYYHDVAGEGPMLEVARGLFTRVPPGGEWYDAIAERMRGWLADTAEDGGDRLVISHGISSRVLRGLMTGLPTDPRWSAPVADGLPQGLVVMVESGRETVVHRGQGGGTA